ncbi:hypothetical protein F5J12DRAFT_903630 [Pisolithus orientalis]|uniref:uncharacterized protein n=1 Tax=Pisolithus orientalis TaxID=936130 RepID=UPI0022243BB1|nr:uncharacterized protein F5J12DRAFT_903630 [Pisolithus orientalis]KAI6028690.1 hypothetical protein F5J12DRAFT_903630 [Pisolithus orientalis]
MAQKRSATSSSAEASTTSLPSHATKKTRFVEPSEDPTNFAEEVDAALETPSTQRKGRVKTEGYESDSSDDGEGVVYSRRKDKQEDTAEEEDMFAMADKEEHADDGGKKKESYLRLGDIEGQEFNEAQGESDSDEDDEPEDEDDAERRKKAGMGYELSSFNMREEMEEGKFSADGTYIKTFDPHSVHDRWMEGVSENDIKLARRRKKQQDRVEKERMKAEERELEQSGGRGALEIQLLGLLKRGETVLEALSRLGNRLRKNQQNNNPLKPDPRKLPNGKTKNDSDIDLITHLASKVLSLGDVDIYSKTYEELVRSVRASGQVAQDWMPPSADIKYEYRWNVVGAETGDTFGPFSEDEMKRWHNAAYFGQFGEKVKVRSVGGEWGDWDDVLG